MAGRDGRRRLAPLYDLVPTVYLPTSLVERAPAMRIGRAARIDGIGPDDWAAFAEDTGYRKAFVLERVRWMSSRMLALLPAVAAGIVSQGGDAERVQRIETAVADNIGSVGLH